MYGSTWDSVFVGFLAYMDCKEEGVYVECHLPLKVTIGTMEKIITSIHQHDTILENTLPLVFGTCHLDKEKYIRRLYTKTLMTILPYHTSTI